MGRKSRAKRKRRSPDLPIDLPASPSNVVFCPDCGAPVEIETLRQVFNVWTASTNPEAEPMQTVEWFGHQLRCAACGYEEYEPPDL